MTKPGTRLRPLRDAATTRLAPLRTSTLPEHSPENPGGSLFKHAPDAFMTYDLGGQILSANLAAGRSLGYGLEELVGRSIAEIDPGYDAAEFLMRHSAMVLGVPAVSQAVHRRKDGTTFPVEVRVSLIDEGKRPVFLAVAREVADRRKLEDDLRQSQKMEALGRLAGGVAHDFNNLLTAILGYSDVILGRMGPGSEFRTELGEVKRAGERAADLTKQLLAFSRRQPTRPKVLELSSLVSGIEGMLRRLIPEAIRVEFVLATGDLCVRVDPGQIDQVTLNLALNARDAMAQGGVLRIATALATLDPNFVAKHPAAAPGDYAVLSVQDTGVGIPKEQLSHLFEPFYTTKAPGRGTGLGLATVYGITKQSGGFLTVSSESGKGSTFRVYLPLVQERPQTQSDSQILPVFSGSEKILLVEDEAAVRLFVAQGLRAHGYIVTDLPGPEEAIRFLDCEKSIPDLLLTDMVMPGMTGRELARALRDRYPRMGVVYMSGYTEDVALQEGRIEEGSGFIAKPFLLNDLLARIRKTLARAESLGALPRTSKGSR